MHCICPGVRGAGARAGATIVGVAELRSTRTGEGAVPTQKSKAKIKSPEVVLSLFVSASSSL